jgi:iron complex outermembrane receptor protein
MAFFVASAVDAQTASAPAAPAAPGALGDIIVTARRTSEKLQDVPVAVTALGPKTIEEQKIRSLLDVQRVSPSLSISPVNGVGSNASVQLRGMVQTDAGIGVDPSVGVYMNEVYMARPDGLDSAIYDVSSIQVLKGPQGTLFGRNSVGGAVLIETRKPGHEFGGYVDASLEAPYGYSVDGALDIPVSDTAGFRIAGSRQYIQGYTKVSGQDFRLDDRNRWAGRITFDAELAPGLKTTFVADGFRSHANGTAVAPLYYNPALITPANPVNAAYIAEFNAYQARDSRTVTRDFKPFNHAYTLGASNTTSYQLSPELLIKNIIGWHKQRSFDLVDQDGTAADVLATTVMSNTHQFSEELQLQGDLFNKTLSFVAGGYYFQESGINYAHSWVRSPITTPAGNENRFYGANRAESVFAHLSYKLPIAVPAHIFGGIRYTQDRREIGFRTRSVSASGATTCLVAGAPADCDLRRRKTFTAPTWDVGVDIRPVKQMMLYASVSRGYRSGGFNGRATSAVQQQPYAPEYATSFEVGTKTNWTVGSVRASLDVSAYYVKYDDIQRELRFVTDSGGVVSFVVNAAKARIQGLEAESTINFSRDVSLSGYFSYTDPKYQKFEQLGVDETFNKFSYVPKYQAGATFDWTVAHTSAGDFALDLNWLHKSGFFLDLLNVPGAHTKAYDIGNAFIAWNHMLGSKISAQLYVHNMFDKRYALSGQSQASSLGISSVYLGPPRTVGVSVNVPFGG